MYILASNQILNETISKQSNVTVSVIVKNEFYYVLIRLSFISKKTISKLSIAILYFCFTRSSKIN